MSIERKIIHLLKQQQEGQCCHTLWISDALQENYQDVFDAVRRLIKQGAVAESPDGGGWEVKEDVYSPYDKTYKQSKHWGF